jgi:hypothetical protein
VAAQKTLIGSASDEFTMWLDDALLVESLQL